MSFGAETSLDTTAGLSAVEGASSYAAAGASEAGPQLVGGGGGALAQLLQHIAADPESTKAIGDLVKHLGSGAGALGKVSPQAKQMLSQAIMGGSQGKSSGGQQSTPIGPAALAGPLMGDMNKYLPPEVAQDVLGRMGIPYGK